MFVKLMDIFGTKTRALEMLAVYNDVKPVARLGFYDDEIPRALEFCEKNGLTMLLSDFKVLLTDKYRGYSDKGVAVTLDDPNDGMLFAYISKDPEKAKQAKLFEKEGDQYNLGLALGYPLCCVEFFVKNWEERSKLDNDYTEPCVNNSVGASFPFHNNFFMREQDTTLLFHFPCTLNCKESQKLAKLHLELLRKADSKLAYLYEHRLRNWFEVGERSVEFD
ncbi:DUF483 domain-containing protein [Candidatus Woesearchaeota archaeon]|nr:DUF483 domain-containing protein [Candidatus Woesearchaeota archaeon]